MNRLCDWGPHTLKWRDLKTGDIRTSRSLSLNHKANVVCHDCNHGWMSRLEDEIAKPVLAPMILVGSARTLSVEDVGAVAAFAFEASVVADRINPLRLFPFFSPQQTQAFAATLTIPPWIQMWIARFESAVSPSALMFTDYRKGRMGAARGYEIFILTYAIGHLAFQVAAQKRTKVALGPSNRPFVKQHPVWGRFASEFWPIHSSSLEWPPPQFLDDHSIEQFCYRWRNLVS